MGSYWTRPELLAVSSRLAKPTISLRLRTLWRLYSYETLLDRLAEDLQDVAVELWPFIQQEEAVVGQRHLAWHRDLATPDQPHIRDRVVGGTERAGRHDGGAVAGEAGDAVNAGGLGGFWEGHR